MRTSLRDNPRGAAIATAAVSAGFIGLSLVAASADDVSVGSLETAPALSCPNADRVVLPHGAADHVLDAALTPAQVALSYVRANAGWTAGHAVAANTLERPIADSAGKQVAVELRDAGNRRIAVFVVTRNDGAWQLTRTFECAAPLPAPAKSLKETLTIR